MKDENKNETLTFEKVLASFQNYLVQDDCAEVIQTSRGYAVVEWDDRLGSWTEVDHCPSPAVLQENLMNHMASFLEYGYTSGNRQLTDAEKNKIQALLSERIPSSKNATKNDDM